MSIRASDLVGRWSHDLGHVADLSSDRCLVFKPDNTGAVETGDERIEFTWRLTDESRLVLSVAGRESGPSSVEITEEELPLGRFEVLVSDGALLPFGQRRFTRMPSEAE